MKNDCGKWYCDACEEYHNEGESCSVKDVRDYRNARIDKLVNGDYD